MSNLIVKSQVLLALTLLFVTEIVAFTLIAFVQETNYNETNGANPVYLYKVVGCMHLAGLAFGVFFLRMTKVPVHAPADGITAKLLLERFALATIHIPIGYKIFFYCATLLFSGVTLAKATELPFAAFSYFPLVLGWNLAIVFGIISVIWLNDRLQGSVLNPVLWTDRNDTEPK